ncbi:MAG: adenylate kinase [Alphaproteobacteria bacterium]
MIIVLIGGPGAGKGTQARLIEDKFEIVQLSTGDMLRAERDSGSPLGKEIEAVISKGQLVSDELISEMISNRIEKADCANGFILDGYPRTLEQASMLDGILKDKNLKLDAVVEIVTDDEALVERISGRFTCGVCGEGYHDKFKPTKVAGICDVCGATEDKFVRRTDDNAETVRDRLKVFHEQTQPITLYYEKAGLLKKVDGMQDIDAVTQSIFEVLSEI